MGGFRSGLKRGIKGTAEPLCLKAQILRTHFLSMAGRGAAELLGTVGHCVQIATLLPSGGEGQKCLAGTRGRDKDGHFSGGKWDRKGVE